MSKAKKGPVGAKIIVPPKGEKFRLDFGCGDNKKEGFLGVDIARTNAADYVFDLSKFPFPIATGVVDEIHCSHFFEHLTGNQRMGFMDECYRILKPGAQMTVITPYWTSARAFGDPTHQWPPVCEMTFLYFNKKWREDNKLAHYPISCNFSFSYGYALDSDMVVRSQEYQQFALRHYVQAANDLHTTLTKE